MAVFCFDSDEEGEEGNVNPTSDLEFDANKDEKKEVSCSFPVCRLLFERLLTELLPAHFQVGSSAEGSEVKPASGLKVRTPEAGLWDRPTS